MRKLMQGYLEESSGEISKRDFGELCEENHGRFDERNP